MPGSTWIWYPGDFEIWLHWNVSMMREERGTLYPPFWRLDTFYGCVTFRKQFFLSAPEEITFSVEGRSALQLDGQRIYTHRNHLSLGEGEHELLISVVNQVSPPALYVQGSTLVSDASWHVSSYSGRDGGMTAAEGNAQNWVEVGWGNFHTADSPPSSFRLATTELYPEMVKQKNTSRLLDFGKETFGYLRLQHVSGQGTIAIYYGESEEEALSPEACETLDTLVRSSTECSSHLLPSRAFRYVQVVTDPGIVIDEISLLHEYLPLERRGTFRCSNKYLNNIWETALYTLHLNTREFFLDGIKRDRWVWSGDAYQSALMNYYTFFDQDVVRRTFIALRGKDPVETHLNLIMDYTFYWFLGLYDYYLYTADEAFIRQNYSRMVSLLEFCLRRRNQDGWMEGLPGDWVFIDWADMDNRGEVSTEQVLFARSLEIMALFANLVGQNAQASEWSRQAEHLKQKIFECFWNDEQGCLIHRRYGGKQEHEVTRYPNIFALLFGYLNETQSEQIKKRVILNENLESITTPYMRFYELAALCEVGEQRSVLTELVQYWGGMLDAGATTFWEVYDPHQQGMEQYAMYGRPFGKSLCHAWGASPLYVLGKYFLGVRPLTPGFQTYLIEPCLGGLDWIEGTVPLPQGQIDLSMNRTEIKVHITSELPRRGSLRFQSITEPVSPTGQITSLGGSWYELLIDSSQKEYTITYTSLDAARNREREVSQN